MTLLLVMLGGAVGAAARYLVDRLMPETAVPLGTLTVNVAGSFILGLLAGLGTGAGSTNALVGVGFCGALTTWSAFAFQTVDAQSRRASGLNLAATLVIGFAAVMLGRAAGTT